MRTCKQCGLTKSLEDFYKAPNCAEGRAFKCKECVKRGVRINYRENRAHYQAYERVRSKQPHRLAMAGEARRANPQKYKARTAVANAVRDGRLVPMPCEVCGSAQVQAHHEDYSQPLAVMWLCFEHHRARHGQVADATDGVRSFDVTQPRRKAA